MIIQIISLFPEMFAALTDYGVISRAISREVLQLTFINPRDYADDERKSVDDRPFGGGPGMVMMAEPLARSIIAAKRTQPQAKVIYLSPQGRRFNHGAAVDMASDQSLILLAGRYEGIDERVVERLVDEEWSIGDVVLSGGELAAMVMVDAITRLLPNSLGNADSAVQDSFANGLLDHPHYTRPAVYNGDQVPSVLLGGDHQAIANWRMQQSLGRTWLRRPELLSKLELTDQQQMLLDEFKSKGNNQA